MARHDAVRRVTLRFLVAVVACTLSVASFASVHVPCKSGQKPVQKGSAVCTPLPAAKSKTTAKAPARTLAKAKNTVRGKATSRTRAHAKATVRGKAATKTKAGARVVSSAAVIATTPTAFELPPSQAIVDCGSTQILAQGGAAQCPMLSTPKGSTLVTQPQANPGTACFAALAGSHASRQLASRVPFLTGSAATPQALVNTGVPNKMEKQELGSVMAGYSMCLDMAANWRKQTYAPAVVTVLDAYWHTAQSILGELATGKRTFGDAAKAIAENDQVYKGQIGTL